MDFSKILKAFGQKKILVIGDLILDRYIWGKVERISPEAPVPVVEVTSDTFTLGGAANVAGNIVALGGGATVAGVVGADTAADVVKRLMTENRMEYLAFEDKRPTTVKTRVIAHNQQVVRFDKEDKEKIGGRALRELISLIETDLAGYDAVILSDYKKGVITTEVVKAVVRKARKRGIFVAVDPKVGHFHLYKNVSLITPNTAEAQAGSGVEIRDEESLIKAGRTLLRKLSCSSVLITRGPGGMSLFTKNEVVHIPTAAKKVFDVTGAGDTVIAVFSLALASGASMREAAFIANQSAGIVVAEVGTAVVTQAKLRQALRTARPEYRVQKLGGRYA